jgi:hypothetical protein
MRQVTCTLVVLSLLATSAPAFAQQPQTRMRSGPLALAGLVTAVVGAAQFAPVGEEYHIVGYDYCVTGTYTVEAGECQVNPNRRPLGWALLAAGGAMMAVGFSRVTVYPTVKGAGVAYTLRW